ncbi:PREDICTED: uncharacterized protein LOC106107231 isoform X2 [Papilio polytes]|uniref:uncharacterized protein LOC106107231 isoform X2 n=1 Tax=Papilio polytes TaxID=76194 RepID=UPI00067648F4|nr:PREDICTED: uncharacterized protein LOC106107231 isoform X2 [Papilio polytes]
MSREINVICVLMLLKCTCGAHLAKIAPEDVSAGLTVVYGFAPRLKLGNDHRVGFGFRFGNHADFQILYEFGPQTISTPTQTIKARSAPYRHTRKPRRRPFIDLLIRTGLLREVERVDKHPRNVTKKQKNSTAQKA